MLFIEQKVFRGKLSFLHTLFLENEAQIDRNNYGTMLFMSKQVSLPKISSILQKMKIGQNSIYALFARRPSIIGLVLVLHVQHSIENCSIVKAIMEAFSGYCFLWVQVNTSQRNFRLPRECKKAIL